MKVKINRPKFETEEGFKVFQCYWTMMVPSGRLQPIGKTYGFIVIILFISFAPIIPKKSRWSWGSNLKNSRFSYSKITVWRYSSLPPPHDFSHHQSTETLSMFCPDELSQSISIVFFVCSRKPNNNTITSETNNRLFALSVNSINVGRYPLSTPTPRNDPGTEIRTVLLIESLQG